LSRDALTANGITPDSLESLQDKQFCQHVLDDLATAANSAQGSLTQDEQQELHEITQAATRVGSVTQAIVELGTRAEPVMARVPEEAKAARQMQERRLKRRRRWIVPGLLLSAFALFYDKGSPVSTGFYVFWGAVLLLLLAAAWRYWTIRAAVRAADRDYDVARRFSGLRAELEALEQEYHGIQAQLSELTPTVEAIVDQHPDLEPHVQLPQIT